MTNLEANKDKLKNLSRLCVNAHICRYGRDCCGKSCKDCEFHGDSVEESIKAMLAEYKEPIKLTKFEYDLLMSYINKGYSFKNYSELKEMRNKGYFKGITDMDMTTQEILKNCEVIDE